MNWKHEPTYYDDKAYGCSFYTGRNLGPVSEIGSWQTDSLWKAYIAKVNGSSTNLTCP